MLSKFCCFYHEYENKVIVTNKLQIFLEHIVDYLKKFLLHLNFFKFNLQISNKYKFNQNIHNILCYFLLK